MKHLGLADVGQVYVAACKQAIGAGQDIQCPSSPLIAETLHQACPYSPLDFGLAHIHAHAFQILHQHLALFIIAHSADKAGANSQLGQGVDRICRRAPRREPEILHSGFAIGQDALHAVDVIHVHRPDSYYFDSAHIPLLAQFARLFPHQAANSLVNLQRLLQVGATG